MRGLEENSSFPSKPRETPRLFSLGNSDSQVIGGLRVHTLPILPFQGLIIAVGKEQERVGSYIYKVWNERSEKNPNVPVCDLAKEAVCNSKSGITGRRLAGSIPRRDAASM